MKHPVSLVRTHTWASNRMSLAHYQQKDWEASCQGCRRMIKANHLIFIFFVNLSFATQVQCQVGETILKAYNNVFTAWLVALGSPHAAPCTSGTD
jgi:hypothetical protein